ncbi:hypothetical protein [Streptomyces sp. NBC_01198]|nr:hypothetical protein OG702_29785 [Streptomyces sp. NBC_01198]
MTPTATTGCFLSLLRVPMEVVPDAAHTFLPPGSSMDFAAESKGTSSAR